MGWIAQIYIANPLNAALAGCPTDRLQPSKLTEVIAMLGRVCDVRDARQIVVVIQWGKERRWAWAYDLGLPRDRDDRWGRRWWHRWTAEARRISGACWHRSIWKDRSVITLILGNQSALAEKGSRPTSEWRLKWVTQRPRSGSGKSTEWYLEKSQWRV